MLWRRLATTPNQNDNPKYIFVPLLICSVLFSWGLFYNVAFIAVTILQTNIDQIYPYSDNVYDILSSLSFKHTYSNTCHSQVAPPSVFLCLTCEFLLFLFLVRVCEWTNIGGIRFSKWTVLKICRPQAHITHAPLDNVWVISNKHVHFNQCWKKIMIILSIQFLTVDDDVSQAQMLTP